MWSTEENAPSKDWIVARGKNKMWVKTFFYLWKYFNWESIFTQAPMMSRANTRLIAVLSLWNVLLFAIVREQRLTVRAEDWKKFQGTFRFTQPNCESNKHFKAHLTRLSNCHSFNYRLLNDNQLGRIKSDGLFGRLPNLIKLDLRRNQITGIEPQAFDGALKIQEMLISENKMTEVHNKMFMGLHNLKTL